MRRFISALSIAALLFVPAIAMAGATLYGNARISVNYVDDDPKKGTSAQDNVSRLGIKGEYGDEIKGFFHLQASARVAPDGPLTVATTGVDSEGAEVQTSGTTANDNDAFGRRFFVAGIKSAFGTLSYGLMTNAYKMPGYKLNGKYYDTTTLSVGGGVGFGGASYGLSPANNGFTNTAVQYVTPSLSGVKVSGTVALDGTSKDQHGVIAAASHSHEGINVGVAYASNVDGSMIPNIAPEGDALRAYGSYKMEGMKFGLSYETIDIVGDQTDDKINYIFAIGSKALTAKADLIVMVGTVDAGSAEGMGGTVGVNYGLTEKTEVLVSGSYGDLENDTAPKAVSLLFVHNFSISEK